MQEGEKAGPSVLVSFERDEVCMHGWVGGWMDRHILKVPDRQTVTARGSRVSFEKGRKERERERGRETFLEWTWVARLRERGEVLQGVGGRGWLYRTVCSYVPVRLS
mmetsp:Transcript_14680/g.29654  ORF Transcript_14680/g.29654 Transcript_14680/m.29654 type:complete len:107 (+) Transcript_14680:195-515(+)